MRSLEISANVGTLSACEPSGAQKLGQPHHPESSDRKRWWDHQCEIYSIYINLFYVQPAEFAASQGDAEPSASSLGSLRAAQWRLSQSQLPIFPNATAIPLCNTQLWHVQTATLFKTKDEEVQKWNAMKRRNAHCNNSKHIERFKRLSEIENRTVNPPSNSMPYCTSASRKESWITWHSKLPRLSNDKRGKVVGRPSWNETAHVNLTAWLFYFSKRIWSWQCLSCNMCHNLSQCVTMGHNVSHVFTHNHVNPCEPIEPDNSNSASQRFSAP